MIVWRYLPRGKVKHALRTTENFIGHRSTAVCGTAPAWFMPQSELWWGTGKQSEYEEVEKLPKCKRCIKLLKES